MAQRRPPVVHAVVCPPEVEVFCPNPAENEGVNQLQLQGDVANADANKVIIQILRSPEPTDPSFRVRFMMFNKYLMTVWGATLVSLAYLHAHIYDNSQASENDKKKIHDYKVIMSTAAILVACSFYSWLISYYFYDDATEDPGTNPAKRLILAVCYGSAMIAFGLTFMVHYFPGNHTKLYASVYGGAILVCMGFFEGKLFF